MNIDLVGRLQNCSRASLQASHKDVKGLVGPLCTHC